MARVMTARAGEPATAAGAEMVAFLDECLRSNAHPGHGQAVDMVLAIEAEAADARTTALTAGFRDEARRVISNAYYDARGAGRTMEQAADASADAVAAILAALDAGAEGPSARG